MRPCAIGWTRWQRWKHESMAQDCQRPARLVRPARPSCPTRRGLLAVRCPFICFGGLTAPCVCVLASVLSVRKNGLPCGGVTREQNPLIWVSVVSSFSCSPPPRPEAQIRGFFLLGCTMMGNASNSVMRGECYWWLGLQQHTNGRRR